MEFCKFSELKAAVEEKTGRKITIINDSFDLTFEAVKNLSFDGLGDDIISDNTGIYKIINGQKIKQFIYLQNFKVDEHGLPKYHLIKCSTVLRLTRAKYIRSNSFNVSVFNRNTGNWLHNQTLKLCGNCRNEIAPESPKPNFTSEFWDDLFIDDNEQEINNWSGYPKNWAIISSVYREKHQYICENCGFDGNNTKRNIETHHYNSKKTDNREENLECLCTLCHWSRHKDKPSNFERRSSIKRVTEFIENNEEEIIKHNELSYKEFKAKYI